MQYPGCQHENPTGQKFCGGCGTPLRSINATGSPGASYADLERTLSATLDQRPAIVDILGVIASSSADLQAVLDAVAERAARLGDATDVLIHRVDGQMPPMAPASQR